MVQTPAGAVPCLIVRHPRARRLTLRLHAGELRLTVPARTAERDIAAFLSAGADWIARHTADGPAAPAPLADGDRVALLDGHRVLRLVPGTTRAGARADATHLTVRLPAGTDAGPVVEAWYRSHARRTLGAMAQDLAGTMGLRVAGVSVRDPRGRWGSCSASGRLSFSWRLLLAPSAVASHVVAHEVCHLRHLDHSPDFHALLREVDPATDEARAWLRANGPLLHLGPAWRSLTAGNPAGAA
jgi:predicted metal-dependent hydrolase